MSSKLSVNSLLSGGAIEVAIMGQYGYVWTNELAHMLPDEIEVFNDECEPAEFVCTIGDIKESIKKTQS